MKRRNFLGAAGAYATLIRPPAEAQTAATARKRARIDLNGAWDQSMDGHFVRDVQVPSSSHPLGRYELSREFVLPRLAPDEHAILHFEGIALSARASCNGTELGSLIPYVPHEFDISSAVRERSNTIRVGIADLIPEGADADAIAMGVNPGWEAYGGIIRDVWIELRPATFIENAQLRYTLEPGYRAGHCVVRAFLRSRGPVTGKAEAKLLRAGRTFANGSQAFSTAAGAGEVEIPFDIADPALWSPESPDLYDAVVSIESPTGTDQSSFRTGFREFRVKGTGFELNGNPITLDGVCRHDMWKDQGFTLTRQQMRQDMQAIQAMGANYRAPSSLSPPPVHRRTRRRTGLAGDGGAWILAGGFPEDPALDDRSWS